jgi:hypothetical protein
MATRSTIGYRTPEGRIVAVYCHWDGYPSNNGRILSESYTDVAKIAELISGGSISSLQAEVGTTHSFSRMDTLNEAGITMSAEDYEAAYGKMTTFYARDRGEELQIRIYNDAREFVAAGEEYNYLFNGIEWLVNDHGEVDDIGWPMFDLLSTVLETEAA